MACSWVSEDMDNYSIESYIPGFRLLPAEQQEVIVRAVSRIAENGYNVEAVVAPFTGLRSKTNGQFPDVVACIDLVVKAVEASPDDRKKKAAVEAYKFLLQLERVYTNITPDQAARRTKDLRSRLSADSLRSRVLQLSAGLDDSDQGIPIRRYSSGFVDRAGSPKRNISRRVKRTPI